MNDLERLFRRLVDNLIAIDPARLHRPMTLGELQESVIPYRTNRRALSIDSAEDYDTLILRLCAGEGGFVRMVSEDVAQVLQDQLATPNPDLEVLRENARAELVLGTEPLAHALGPGPEEAYAPPDEELDLPVRPAPPPEPPRPPVTLTISGPRPAVDTETGLKPPASRMSFTAEPAATGPIQPAPPRMTAEPEPAGRPPVRRDSGVRCSYCGGRLPAGRTVNFCPHCGQNQSFTRCPECQADLEIGWRHCIACGHQVGDG